MVKVDFCEAEVCRTSEEIQSKLFNQQLSEYFENKKGYIILLEDGKVVGTTDRERMRYNLPLETTYFRLAPDIFLKARDWYHEHERERNKRFLAIDENGRQAGLVYWQSTTVAQKMLPDMHYDHYFWDYNFVGREANNHLLKRADSYVFLELEEYTHAIASYILHRYPDKDIYFLDKKAEWPIWHRNAENLHVLRSWDEIPDKGRKMFVYTSNFNMHGIIPDDINLTYTSQSVMFSMVWGSHMYHPGNLHPDKVVVLLDNFCGHGGLGDLTKVICNYAWQAEQQGMIPVADVSEKSHFQFYESEKNIWEELFYPLSDITVQEALQCRNLIRASKEGNWDFQTIRISPYWHEAHRHMSEYMPSKIRLNEKTWGFIIEHAPLLMKPLLEQKFAQENGNTKPNAVEGRFLGVNLRGTDYRPETRGGKAGNTASLSTMILFCRSIMATGFYSALFLATEDQEYFMAFKEEFGSRLCFVERPRIRYEPNSLTPVRMRSNVGGNSPLLNGKLYITDIMCMTVCDDLISNVNSGAYQLTNLWKKGEYGFRSVLHDGWLAPSSSRVVRVDIKNCGGRDNALKVYDGAGEGLLRISTPAWFTNDEGSGCVVDVVQDDCQDMKLHLRCFGQGTLFLFLRGIDKRGKYGRLALWTTYTSLKINDEEILSEPIDAWHDKPLVLKREVEDGDEFDVSICWQPYHYAPQEMSDLLQQML